MVRHGTSSNIPSVRFDDPGRMEDGDWAETAGETQARRVYVQVERPRTAITRNDSPDIPFDRSFNAYRGCEHGCAYCFARPTHAYHNLSPGLDFETRLFAKPDGPALLRAEFARASYRPAVLAMGTNTDPYQPIERQWRITRAILSLCREVNHPVAITTKSDRILDDLPVIASLAADRLAMVMISVTTLDRALAMAMEPRAAAPHRRLAAIRALSDAGVPVTVSISPLIPALNDHELEAIVTAAAEAGAVSAVSLPIRLPHEVAPLFREWLATNRPDRAERVLAAIRAMRGGRMNDPGFGTRHRAQGEWGRLMRQRLALLRTRYGLRARDWDLDCTRFIRPDADARQGRLL